jgi:DNA primase catalytic core
MSIDIQEIYSRLLARDYALTLFGDLEKRKKSGRGYTALCPFHQEKAPSFSFSMDKPVYHCFGCGESGDWIRYLEKKERLPFQEALERLAREAGVELKGYDRERWEKEAEWGNALEMALSYFKTMLWKEQGNETLNYLKGRGYSEDEIKEMELGFYPSQKEFKKHIEAKVNNIDTIKSLGLEVGGMGETHRAVIPYRDPVGRLKGFIVRAVKEIEPKYLFTAGVEKDTLFNLHEARGRDTLIAVEGFLDALISTQRGVSGVVALGGDSLTEAQLENALRYRVKGFVLALDNDEAGQKGTERALDLMSRKGLGRKGLGAYIVTLPEGYKDPDELIKAKGVEAFKELIEKAESGARWKARRILSKHDMSTPRGRDDVLREVVAYQEGLNPIDRDDLKKTLNVELDISEDTLNEHFTDYNERKAGEREEKGYRDLFREGLRLVEEGKIAELRELLSERIPGLRAKAVTRVIEPYTLQGLQEDITRTRPGLKAGYQSLDGLVTIPQEAITIVAGRPSHGKTTFLLNVFLKMIEADPDKAFFFFSYEESRGQVGLKLINILSGDPIDERKNLIQLEEYLRSNKTGRPKIEGGKARFKKFTERGRLWVIDEPLFIDDLTDTIAYLKDRHDMGAVFIDYIQKIKIKGRYQTRQIEIQRISERILETAKALSLPIILGAQLGRDKEHADKVRLDNLRESGDIEQDANLVLGLYNDAMQKAQDRDEALTDSRVDLKLTILKNRNGAVNEEVVLSFDRPILTITEKEKGRWSK